MAPRKKISTKTIALREKLWPDLTEEHIWYHRAYDGFVSVPRTMPVILSIIDDLTKGHPASATYFALWCMTFPQEMYVSLQNADELAFHAGFTGQRATRQWADRMKLLEGLGFIRTAAGPRGGLSHAAIPNPHLVVRRLYAAKMAGLTASSYNTLVQRANEIGATDMEMELPEVRAQREAAAGDQIPF